MGENLQLKLDWQCEGLTKAEIADNLTLIAFRIKTGQTRGLLTGEDGYYAGSWELTHGDY